jgi:hypothetical protein
VALVLPGDVDAPPAPSAEPASKPAASTAPTARRAERRSAGPAHAAARAGESGSSADEELQLLVRAERALRARHPELALSLAAELEERFPGSGLQEERRAIALLAHCQRDAVGARSLAEGFAQRYPGSVYVERIARGCSPLTIGAGADTDVAKGGHSAPPRDFAQPEDP